MRYKLSDLCAFVDGRVAVADLDFGTYISTENMLPNKEGVTRSAGLPTISQTQAIILIRISCLSTLLRSLILSKSASLIRFGLTKSTPYGKRCLDVTSGYPCSIGLGE